MIGKRARVGLTLAIILNLVFAALVFVPAVGAATVAVTPANLGSWTIQDATCGGSNTGIYDFIAGPGTPPLGSAAPASGSAAMATPTAVSAAPISMVCGWTISIR